MAAGRFGSADTGTADSPAADELEPSDPARDLPHHPYVVTPEPSNGIRCRQIALADLPTIADLLHLGFPSKSRVCLMNALERLGAHCPPEGFPQFGYMLESGRDAVGVLLTICSVISEQGRRFVRCNVACWYVLPRFRLYAPLLRMRAGRYSDATQINISPATATLQTIEAQGFHRFSAGSFVGLPALNVHPGNVKLGRLPRTAPDAGLLSLDESNILQDHERYGCVSLVCQAADGCYPFVFRRRAFKRFRVPGAQLLYCRDLEDFRRFAGPLGRFLALRGMPWVLVGTDGPIAGIPGKYFPGRLPMYFRGPDRPRPGDLIYTEAALFGF
jgi:hypothetical protein